MKKIPQKSYILLSKSPVLFKNVHSSSSVTCLYIHQIELFKLQRANYRANPKLQVTLNSYITPQMFYFVYCTALCWTELKQHLSKRLSARLNN